MSSMIELHREARESVSAVVHEFMACYQKGSNVVYAFFEGKEDLSFYLSVIESYLKADWQVRRWCVGRKDKVYEVHGAIDWNRFSDKAAVFFVDRDLSDLLKEVRAASPNLYVTDYYSVENALVGREMCRRVLDELYGFVGAPAEDTERVLAVFETNKDDFCKLASTVMAWSVLCKQDRLKPCLDNIRMGDLFEIVSEHVRCRLVGSTESLIAYCEDRCGLKCASATTEATESLASTIRSAEPIHTHIRGKYLLWLLIHFVEYVHREWRRFFPTVVAQPKKHLQLGLNNAMEVLGPRVRAPDSLRTFLNATIGNYVRQATEPG